MPKLCKLFFFLGRNSCCRMEGTVSSKKYSFCFKRLKKLLMASLFVVKQIHSTNITNEFENNSFTGRNFDINYCIKVKVNIKKL